VGSVGGNLEEIFNCFDYRNRFVYLKTETIWLLLYTISGIEIMQTGMQWVQETVHLQGVR
jgi:ABC-type xylose transport system permease subunit